MKNLQTPTSDFLLERSISELHHESKEWLSELAFWKNELSFFQKLLDYHGPDADNIDEKKSLDHFQHLITYYNGELLDEFEQKVRNHERTLADELLKAKIDEKEYRGVHGQLSSHINSFSQEFRMYKKELFEFIDKLMSK